MKLGDKEIKSLARNMRKRCAIANKICNSCKYEYKYCDKITFPPILYTRKELLDELRSAGL